MEVTEIPAQYIEASYFYNTKVYIYEIDEN